MAFPSSPNASPLSHSRNQSFSHFHNLDTTSSRIPAEKPASNRTAAPSSGTFAPTFIKTEAAQQDTERVRGIEGENDFSGKRYVWVKDQQSAFQRGWIVQDLDGDRMLVQCDDGAQREVDAAAVDKVNPGKFDKADDMAELTYLNEPSVVHNLETRYQADLIYVSTLDGMNRKSLTQSLDVLRAVPRYCESILPITYLQQ